MDFAGTAAVLAVMLGGICAVLAVMAFLADGYQTTAWKLRRLFNRHFGRRRTDILPGVRRGR